MKAVLLTSHGGPEMLRYGEAPDPTAGPGEVVVDVYAASVNAADSKVRQGGGRYTLNQFPHILCRDFSGVVSTLGERVTEFAVGDEVFGVVPDHRSLILAPCFANGWCNRAVLTTDVLDGFPFLECSFNRQKILMFGIFGMLLDGSASPSEPTTACRANGILRQNLGQRFGELLIKVCNVPATSHVFIA